MRAISCEQLLEDAAELALGIADAESRARAIAHVEQCSSCRQHLSRLRELTEGLASLSPAIDPPNGFESAVLTRLRSARATDDPEPLGGKPSHRMPRALAFVILAALLAFGGFLGGGVAKHRGERLMSAPLVEGGTDVGQVVVSTGPRPWVSMAITVPGLKGKVRCELEERDGTPLPVGSFSLTDGYGYWAAPIPEPSSPIVSARVVGTRDSVLLVASFA